MLQMDLRFLHAILLIRSSLSLMGYDCEAPHGNGTIISLLKDDDNCQLTKEGLTYKIVNIEILQKEPSSFIDILSCRIEIDYNLDRIKDNYDAIIRNKRYYLPIDSHACVYMHDYGNLEIGNFSMTNLSVDAVNSRLLPLKTTSDSEHSKLQKDITVYVHIIYKRYTVEINTLANKILLPTGTTCVYANLQCIDEEGFSNFWSPLFRSGCNQTRQTVVYRGTAHRLTTSKYRTAYATTALNKTYMFFILAHHDACNETIHQTEHPQLIIRNISDLRNYSVINKLRSITYIRLLSYDNTNVKDIYISVSIHRCREKENEIHTLVTLAHEDPSLFAYSLLGTPGYSARIRGEAAQLYRCTLVPARIRNTEDCYVELPVTINGQPMYLRPRTRTISTKGTPTTCDSTTTSMYRINNKWITLSPEIVNLTIQPGNLQPTLLPWGPPPETQPPSTHGNEDRPSKLIVFLAVIIAIGIISHLMVTVSKGIKARNNQRTQPSPLPVLTLHQETPKISTKEERGEANAKIAELQEAFKQLERRINRCLPSGRPGLPSTSQTSAAPHPRRGV